MLEKVAAEVDWLAILHHLGHLTAAYVLALPIAFDREAESSGVGLRTFPLVAISCCAYLLIGQDLFRSDEAHARLIYGMMSGIGFIGGGAILKDKGNVSGTSTAAAIWSTGAIGAAVAWQRYEIAIVISLMTFLTLRFLVPLKKYAHR